MPNSKSVVHFPSSRFWMGFDILRILGHHPGDGGGLSPLHLLLILGVKSKCQVSHCLLVDFGWWLTILGMAGDHPGDSG